MYNQGDNIVALATNPAGSSINVVRCSGPGVVNIYKKISFQKKTPNANSANFVNLYVEKQNHKKTLLDGAVVLYFKKPNSYTGGDIVEYCIHGGVVVVTKLISILVKFGCRMAMPGEFTYRAFISGKIDLIQAESINELISSSSSLDGDYLANNVSGALSKQIQLIYKKLENLTILIEHELDFNENEIEFTTSKEIKKKIKIAIDSIKSIISGSFLINKKNNSIEICIIGKPNVGKSSLFNLLVGESRSIVNKTKGTTRDTIEENLSLSGFPVKLIDTAGVRKTKNVIEKEGVLRSLTAIQKSNIIIFVDDTDPILAFNAFKIKHKNVVFVKNKQDLGKATKQNKKTLLVSCLQKKGIKKLLTSLSTLIIKETDAFYKKNMFVLNQRQQAELRGCLSVLEKTLAVYQKKEDLVLLASGLRRSLVGIETVVRPHDKTYIINEIFKGFCVGK